jgi:hypothetical protein
LKPCLEKKKLGSIIQPVVDKILTFIMTEDHPERFNTPELKYLSMKKEFLG